MKTNFLLPSKFKKIGLAFLIPSLILGILTIVNGWEPVYFDWQMPALFYNGILSKIEYVGVTENNFFAEILAILTIISAIFVAFSKEKMEDELVVKLRLESLVWATVTHYVLLIFALILIFDIVFFWFMVLNMFTLLLTFIVRFNWLLFKLNKSVLHEE